MEQLDLMDWLDSKRVIKQRPPAETIQQRAFIIQQLKPIIREFESLGLSALIISEAMAHFSNSYQEQAQKTILKPPE